MHISELNNEIDQTNIPEGFHDLPAVEKIQRVRGVIIAALTIIKIFTGPKGDRIINAAIDALKSL